MVVTVEVAEYPRRPPVSEVKSEAIMEHQINLALGDSFLLVQ